ncbi:hypothetical protein CcCBS67573_g03928 [Chytriomyces confervae]|uniref:C2H2-type domain-containing protein n=1 Tax=Chytriomyces confervae TaxID=246404 RepID=A0A507FGN4_9FUNG|nr:hypothetical protein CcCBS67573_g03928 [Chytriomyces confervae]
MDCSSSEQQQLRSVLAMPDNLDGLSLSHEPYPVMPADQMDADLLQLLGWNYGLPDGDMKVDLSLFAGQAAMAWSDQSWLSCVSSPATPDVTPINSESRLEKPRPRREAPSDLTCPEEGCGKSFLYPSLLQEHFRRHSGERPFVCSECGKSYTTNNRLKVHTRTHSGDRPYACSHVGCLFRTKQASDLKDHSIRHLSIQDRELLDKKRGVTKCTECNRRFRTEAGLAAHKEMMPICFVDRPGKRRRRVDAGGDAGA